MVRLVVHGICSIHLQLHISNASILCLSLARMVQATSNRNMRKTWTRTRRSFVLPSLQTFTSLVIARVIGILPLISGTQLPSLHMNLIICEYILMVLPLEARIELNRLKLESSPLSHNVFFLVRLHD